jgi:hypothetical protein
MLRRECMEDPVLIDFGLTTQLDESPDLTLLEQDLGNRFLRLPELQGYSPDKQDIRSDITYCVGILFYLLVGQPPKELTDHTGNPPHKRGQMLKIISQCSSDEFDLIDCIFSIGFRQNIKERFQTAKELHKALSLDLKCDTEQLLPKLRQKRWELEGPPKNWETTDLSSIEKSVRAEPGVDSIIQNAIQAIRTLPWVGDLTKLQYLNTQPNFKPPSSSTDVCLAIIESNPERPELINQIWGAMAQGSDYEKISVLMALVQTHQGDHQAISIALEWLTKVPDYAILDRIWICMLRSNPGNSEIANRASIWITAHTAEFIQQSLKEAPYQNLPYKRLTSVKVPDIVSVCCVLLETNPANPTGVQLCLAFLKLLRDGDNTIDLKRITFPLAGQLLLALAKVKPNDSQVFSVLENWLKLNSAFLTHQDDILCALLDLKSIRPEVLHLAKQWSGKHLSKSALVLKALIFHDPNNQEAKQLVLKWLNKNLSESTDLPLALADMKSLPADIQEGIGKWLFKNRWKAQPVLNTLIFNRPNDISVIKLVCKWLEHNADSSSLRSLTHLAKANPGNPMLVSSLCYFIRQHMKATSTPSLCLELIEALVVANPDNPMVAAVAQEWKAAHPSI